jgi:hypothetical protein
LLLSYSMSSRLKIPLNCYLSNLDGLLAGLWGETLALGYVEAFQLLKEKQNSMRREETGTTCLKSTPALKRYPKAKVSPQRPVRTPAVF